MYIKDENGNLINKNYIVEIYANIEPFKDGTYGVVASIHMNGTRILKRRSTYKEAKKARDNYDCM